MNPRPSGYEPDELPGCSTPRLEALNVVARQNRASKIELSGREKVLVAFGDENLVRAAFFLVLAVKKAARTLLERAAWSINFIIRFPIARGFQGS